MSLSSLVFQHINICKHSQSQTYSWFLIPVLYYYYYKAFLVELAEQNSTRGQTHKTLCTFMTKTVYAGAVPGSLVELGASLISTSTISHKWMKRRLNQPLSYQFTTYSDSLYIWMKQTTKKKCSFTDYRLCSIVFVCLHRTHFLQYDIYCLNIV